MSAGNPRRCLSIFWPILDQTNQLLSIQFHPNYVKMLTNIKMGFLLTKWFEVCEDEPSSHARDGSKRTVRQKTSYISYVYKLLVDTKIVCIGIAFRYRLVNLEEICSHRMMTLNILTLESKYFAKVK